MPSDAARLGLEFLSAKMPHASPKVIMDFLRSMNKVFISLLVVYKLLLFVVFCARNCLGMN